MNRLFKVKISILSKHFRYLEVELKASIISFRFSFARDFMKSLI